MRKRNRQLSIWAISILSLLVLLFSTGLFMRRYLQNQLSTIDYSSFKIQSKEIKIDFLHRTIVCNHIVLRSSVPSLTAHISQLSLKRIQFLPFLFKKKLIADKLTIQEARISYYLTNRTKHTNYKSQKKRSVHLNELTIKNSYIQTIKESTKDTLLSGLLNLELKGINSPSSPLDHSIKNISVKDINLHLTNGLIPISEILKIQFQSINYNSNKKHLSIKAPIIHSSYTKAAMPQQYPPKSDWFYFKAKEVIFNQLKIDSLLSKSKLILSSLIINQLDGTAYKDKRINERKKRKKQLPADYLMLSPFKVHCDSVILNHGRIKYSEQTKNSSIPGTILFNNLHAIITPVSNIPELIKTPTHMSAQTTIMNRGYLKANFIFPNVSYKKPYSIEGKLTPMPLSAFNSMLAPTTSIKIEQGQLQELKFNFHYNSIKSKGNLNFIYKGLKINLLRNDLQQTKKLHSLFLNTFIVHKDNLPNHRSYKQGIISFERDPQKSIFNYWWKSIFSGLKSIAIL